MKKPSQNRQIMGKGISPGIVVGKAYVYEDIFEGDYKRYSITEKEIKKEFTRIKHALQEVFDDLTAMAARVERELDSSFADIFRAHKVILRDPHLIEELKNELEKEHVNAEQAVKDVFLSYRDRLAASEHHLLRDRGDDITDLARRILRSLMGVRHILETVPPRSVLVAQRLLPSEAVFLRKEGVSAIVVEYCGTASHAAILARGLGTPLVSQIKDVKKVIQTGDELLVDGISGRVIIAPDKKQKADFQTRAGEYKRIMVKAQEFRRQPAVTRDGTRIFVMANVGSFEDTLLASENGADGIGLFRLEQFFMRQKTWPDEETIFSALRESLLQMEGLPATVRLLDSGADKKLPYLNYPHEENPMLGRRGVRLLLDYPELMLPQLKALLRLSQEFSLRILVPMVTLTEDMKKVRQAVENAAGQLGLSEIPLLGAMLETPAAALCAAEIARHADFFSIGTNDLTQYVMAAGRENEFMSHYYIEDHPAMVRLIRQVCDGVQDERIEVCGELAGNLKAIPVLLEMAIHHLSVLPLRIPAIKEFVRAQKMKTSDRTSNRTLS